MSITIKDNQFLLTQNAPENMAYEDYEVIIKAYLIASDELKHEEEIERDIDEIMYIGPPTKDLVVSAVVCLSKEYLFEEADEEYLSEKTDDYNLNDYRMGRLEDYIEMGNYANWYQVHRALDFAGLCWAEESGDYNWNGDTYFDIVNSPQVSILGYLGDNSMYMNTSSVFIKSRSYELYEITADYLQGEIWNFGLEEDEVDEYR